MKRLLTIAILLLPLSAWPYEQVELNGYFSCKITKQTVWSVEDGRATVYSGYKDGLDVGDTVTVKYSLLHFTSVDKKSGKRRLGYTGGLFSIHFGGLQMLSTSVRVGSSANEYEIDLYGLYGYPDPVFANKDEGYHFRGDVFSVTGTEKELLMERYYKNDWSGLITAVYGYANAQLIALDCRQKEDSPAEILDFLEKHGYFDE